MTLLLQVACVVYAFSSCCVHEVVLLHAYARGDIIIGGLIPLHTQTKRNTTSGPAVCTNYYLQSFLRSQVMIYAINEINQDTAKALPNITIGYDIYDTCGDVWFAIRAALNLLKGRSDRSDRQSCFLPANFDSALPEPQTKVVIGETFSEVSIAVARVLALSSVAQISYGSTSELLSRKSKFPTFLRTLPSDKYQTKSIAELVNRFNWKSVAIVGSDDEYGKYGSDNLVENFTKNKEVCIDFTDILPGNFAHNNSDTQTKLAKLMMKIQNSPAEAIILFTKGSNVKFIMEAAIQNNFNRTWIASDSWSTSTIINMPGIEKVGQVFGFTSKQNEVPGFKDYVLTMFNRTTNEFIQHYLNHYSNCSSSSKERMKHLDPSCLVNYIDQDKSYNIYLAVNVIVKSLRRLLKCNNQTCERSTNFTASELLKEIKQSDCNVSTTHIKFDANGDPSIGYDILQWNLTGTEKGIDKIGEYWPSGGIKLPQDLVQKMCNVTVTAYNCSKTCEPGQQLKQLMRRCCKQCVPCEEGEISPGNGVACERCNETQYSSQRKDKCVQKKVEYIGWSDPFVSILTSFDILGIIATILFAVLFTIHHSTPVVKAVGGHLCFLELLSLLACFCIVFTFTGKPTVASCIGLPLFCIAFTVCISCILANLFQIMVGFSFDKSKEGWLRKLNYPVAVVAVNFGIQLALFVPWLIIYPPSPKRQPTIKNTLLHCEKGSKELFGTMLGYNALLAFICILFAFKGKRLPDLYKNASLTTISMLLFLVSWIIFIPIYITINTKYTRVIEAAAILVSSYSILCCHLAPKCYIMLFRKEINNEHAITEYIRKHYEQKGMAVVKS